MKNLHWCLWFVSAICLPVIHWGRSRTVIHTGNSPGTSPSLMSNGSWILTAESVFLFTKATSWCCKPGQTGKKSLVHQRVVREAWKQDHYAWAIHHIRNCTLHNGPWRDVLLPKLQSHRANHCLWCYSDGQQLPFVLQLSHKSWKASSFVLSPILDNWVEPCYIAVFLQNFMVPAMVLHVFIAKNDINWCFVPVQL